MRFRFTPDPLRPGTRRAPLLRLSVLLLAFLPMLAEAATVRGKVVRGGPRGDYPAQGVGVTLVSANPRIGLSAKVYSSLEGMYYLYNVPPGRYTLQVWVTPRSVIQVPVNVGNGPFTDVKPVRVP